jgi:hypothetical protein
MLCLILASSSAATSGAAPLIEPWGANSLRIRMTLGDGAGPVQVHNLPGALDESPPTSSTAEVLRAAGASGVVASGNIKASYDPAGGLVVTRISDGEVLLRSLALAVEPCGMVPPAKSYPRKPENHAPLLEGCTADVQNNSDWGHDDLLVNGALHPYPSTSIGDCCNLCTVTNGCGGWSWSG